MNGKRNISTQGLQTVEGARKRLQKNKFWYILVLGMIIGLISTSIAISTSMMNIIVLNAGKISTMKAPITYRSEIRGVFIHETIFAYAHDWNVIAQTLKNYSIDSVYGHFANTYARRPDAEFTAAIAAFHAAGIEFHVCIAGPDEVFYSEDSRWIDDAGNKYPIGDCPNNPTYRAAVKKNVEEIATLYDIDGVMFDYIRYDVSGVCYCPYCKAKFEAWLNETIPASNWPPNGGDFITAGPRHGEFMEWRTIPITEMVRDIRAWMLAIKPNLKFSLAAWTLFADAPTYWRYFLGQDTGKWIAEGYLDMVAPMMYTADLPTIDAEILYDHRYFVGGPEGKISMPAFITTGITPAQFKEVVDETRAKGADGWIIWCYGGPGVTGGTLLVDIVPYLQAIDLPATFSLNYIRVSTSVTEATVTWTTDLPATSKLEYSASPLFNASYLVGAGGFHYWDIDSVSSTVIENSTLVKTHSITFTGLTPKTEYCFRVQSQDPSGTATSEVLTFTTT